MKKYIPIVVALIIAMFVIVGASKISKPDTNVAPANNVSIVDGKQIIEIDAKGGYLPRRSVARAGIPTAIRFNTDVTFDCSAAVRIPSLNISKMLPQTGSTDIDIGVQSIGNLQGSCGMGMYPFEVIFE